MNKDRIGARRESGLDEGGEGFREPGWYRDPGSARGHRYWDGREWASGNPEHDPLETDRTARADGLPRPRREID